jgi:hypothetical protein
VENKVQIIEVGSWATEAAMSALAAADLVEGVEYSLAHKYKMAAGNARRALGAKLPTLSFKALDLDSDISAQVRNCAESMGRHTYWFKLGIMLGRL